MERSILDAFLYYNALDLSPTQIYRFLSKHRIEVVETSIVDIDCKDKNNNTHNSSPITNNSLSFSFDDCLNELSRQCFIISSSISNKNGYGTSQSRNYAYFAIRFDCSTNNSNNRGNTNDNESLWKQFSLLSVNENQKREEEENNMEKFATDSIKTAAKFVVRQIINNNNCYQNDANMIIPLKNEENYNDNNGGMENSRNKSGHGGKLLKLSKTVFKKASSAFTSVLASYDLAHEQIIIPTNDGDMDDYVQHASDECNQHYIDGIDNNDDALKMSQITTNNNPLPLSDSSMILAKDTLWNVQLIFDCTLLIIHHAKQKILSFIKDDELDIYDQYVAVPTANQQQKEQERRGMLLNRWGDNKLSFLAFCIDAGNEAIIASKKQDYESIKVYQSYNFSSPLSSSTTTSVTFIEKLGVILSHLTHGSTLELILMILLETNNAILSSSGDIVSLLFLPSSSSSFYIDKSEQIMSKVHDVDVAIFKLNSTISSLEKRMESLTNQAETMKHRALESKRQQQNQQKQNSGNNINNHNNKVPLMYMKRRQIFLNEIDKCSSSLLNLESGLHSLKRARNDSKLIQIYAMMNDTMKMMRDESMSLSHVEEVMEDFRQTNEDLQEIQDCIGTTSLSSMNPSTNDLFDVDDLEKELLALEKGGDNDDINGGCIVIDNAIETKNVESDSTDKKNVRRKRDDKIETRSAITR